MSGRRFAAAAVLLLGAAAAALWLRETAVPKPDAAPVLQAPNAVDIGFAQWMSVHHDQAIVMSQILLAHRHSRLGELAALIQSSQLLETGRMQGWLAYWQQSLLPTSRRMDWLLGADASAMPQLQRYLVECRAADAGMPGIASSDELNRLRELDGADADTLFLQLMIRHHEGALPMATFAARHAATSVVRDLAGLIVVEQTQEIARMQLLQTALSSDD